MAPWPRRANVASADEPRAAIMAESIFFMTDIYSPIAILLQSSAPFILPLAMRGIERYMFMVPKFDCALAAHEGIPTAIVTVVITLFMEALPLTRPEPFRG